VCLFCYLNFEIKGENMRRKQIKEEENMKNFEGKIQEKLQKKCQGNAKG
jgi:hypothetical protein